MTLLFLFCFLDILPVGYLEAGEWLTAAGQEEVGNGIDISEEVEIVFHDLDEDAQSVHDTDLETLVAATGTNDEVRVNSIINL